jgi:hypothetical protein
MFLQETCHDIFQDTLKMHDKALFVKDFFWHLARVHGTDSDPSGRHFPPRYGP